MKNRKFLSVLAAAMSAAVIMTATAPAVYASERVVGVKTVTDAPKKEVEKPRVKNTSYVDTPKEFDKPREIKLNAAMQGVWNFDYAMVDDVKYTADKLLNEIPSLTFHEDGTIISSEKNSLPSYIQKIASKSGVMTLTVGSARVGGTAPTTFKYTTKTKVLTAEFGEYAAALGIKGTKITLYFVKDPLAVPEKLKPLTVDGAETRKLSVSSKSVTLKASKPGTSWFSTDNSVVTVSGDGVVKPVAAGTAQVLAYSDKSVASVTFTVSGKNPKNIQADVTAVQNVRTVLAKLLKNNKTPYKSENYVFTVTENDVNYIIKVAGTAAKVNEIKNGKTAAATFTFKISKSDLSKVYRKSADGEYKKVS